jgi:hypothetical protein
MMQKTRPKTEIQANWKKWGKKDYGFFFILIPSIILLIYYLPQAIKQHFILNNSNPTIVGIFFSNYTHSEFSHLTGNLLAYFVVMFLLFNIEKNKRMFYTLSAASFILLPFISNILLVYLVPQLMQSQGFSAIVSAFAGYLLYSVYTYTKQSHYRKLNYSFLCLLLAINFLIWQITGWFDFDLFIPILIITVFAIYANRVPIKKIFYQINIGFKNNARQNFFQRTYKIFIFLLLIIFIFSFYKILPSEFVTDTGITNIFSHYMGYCFGVFIPVIITLIKGAAKWKK